MGQGEACSGELTEAVGVNDGPNGDFQSIYSRFFFVSDDCCVLQWSILTRRIGPVQT